MVSHLLEAVLARGGGGHQGGIDGAALLGQRAKRALVPVQRGCQRALLVVRQVQLLLWERRRGGPANQSGSGARSRTPALLPGQGLCMLHAMFPEAWCSLPAGNTARAIDCTMWHQGTYQHLVLEDKRGAGAVAALLLVVQLPQWNRAGRLHARGKDHLQNPG